MHVVSSSSSAPAPALERLQITADGFFQLLVSLSKISEFSGENKRGHLVQLTKLNQHLRFF